MRVALGLGVLGLLVGCGTASSPGGTGGEQPTGSTDAAGGGSGSGGSGSGSGGTSSSGGGSSGGSSSGSSGSSSGSGSGSDAGGSSSGGAGGDAGTYSASPQIPAPSGTCPTIATGTITVSGQSVSIWAGSKGATPAPVLFYWHGTGSTAMEAQYIMGPEITEITAAGGVVASFSTSTAAGTNTGNGVWYTGDFAMADQILACAVKQLNIDTRRVFAAGCSAGGLQTGAMVFSRSAYLAAAMPNSGGETYAGAYGALEAPGHVPALITTHGGTMDEVTSNGYMVSFATTSATLDQDVVSKGGFAVDCNHGAGHCGAPADDIAAQWRFCKDHPFGASPEPYAGGLPSGYPSYCTIIK